MKKIAALLIACMLLIGASIPAFANGNPVISPGGEPIDDGGSGNGQTTSPETYDPTANFVVLSMGITLVVAAGFGVVAKKKLQK